MNPKHYRPRSREEISYSVYARQKIFKRSTEIYIPNKPYQKISAGYELSEKKATSGNTMPTPQDEKEERSTRRARVAAKDIALSNTFELFVTFTFKSNRFDADCTRDKLINWLKRQRKHDKDFQYLIVPELHKHCEECVDKKIKICSHDDRPKALHFHALIHGYKGKLVRSIWPDGTPIVKKKRKVYNFPNYTLGICEVYKIRKTKKDQERASFYPLKYIRKEMPFFKNKKRFWSSRGLSRPTIIENPEEWFLRIPPDHTRKVEYGEYLYFDNKSIEGILL